MIRETRQACLSARNPSYTPKLSPHKKIHEIQVFRVFFKRVLLALKGMVAAGGGDVADDVCGRNGLQSFAEDLRPVGSRLHRLFAHNVKVSRAAEHKLHAAPFFEGNPNVR